MKTSKVYQTFNGLTVFVIAITLSLASCQKDPLPIPGANPTTSADITNVSPSTISVDSSAANHGHTLHYVLVSVSHQPGLSPFATSYTVSLYNDGNVLFQGLHGVTHIGDFKYKIQDASLQRIREILSANFYSINDTLNMIPDMPLIATTYQIADDIAPKTLIDYGAGYPRELISLRKQVEQLLDDNVYINGDTSSFVAVESE